MIVFADIESTGLDERVDHLLEVALVAADDNLVERAYTSIVVKPFGISIDDVKMPLVVREMHEKSGLLADVKRIGVEVADAQKTLIDWLVEHFIQLEDLRKIPIAGNSIGFDRRFLRHFVPRFEGMFSHRSIDVSCLTELSSRWAPSVHANRPKAQKGISHRALEDTRSSIEYLKFFRDSGFVRLDKND